MISCFTFSCRTVVACGTSPSCYACVVECCATKRGRRFMASFTAGRRLHMTTRLTFRRAAVMAVRTSAHNTCVAHRCAAKAIGVFVTGLTASSRLHVIPRFTFSGATVMTICAACNDASMTETCS